MVQSAPRNSVAASGFFIWTKLILNIPFTNTFFLLAKLTMAASALTLLLGELCSMFMQHEKVKSRLHVDNFASQSCTAAVKRAAVHPTKTTAYQRSKEQRKTAALKQVCIWSSKPAWKVFSSHVSLTVAEEVFNKQRLHLLLQRGSLWLSEVNIFTMCCNRTKATTKDLQHSIFLCRCLAPWFGDRNRNCSRQSFWETLQLEDSIALCNVHVCLVACEDFRKNVEK